jgi:uncharacterized membrane protein
MDTVSDPRLDALEREVARLAKRVARLEGRAQPAAPGRANVVLPRPATREPVARAAAGPARRPAAPMRVARSDDVPTADPAVPWSATLTRYSGVNLEQLLGGRLLALVGSAAVLIGLAFFVALAIDRGWMGETARVALAFLGSGLLVAFGAWLYEARGRAQAALAAVGTGIAGLYLSLTAASKLDALVPAAAALPLAFVAGALAVMLALRWNSRTVAGLGILGALLAPALVVGESTRSAIAFALIALASATAVLVWRRWEWLRVASFAVAMPQVTLWVWSTEPPVAGAGVLAAFGALTLVAALGYELRVPPARLRPSTALLVSANALVVGGVGALMLADRAGGSAPGLWLVAIALAHGALGVTALALRRTSREIGLVLVAVAITSADIAFGLLAQGPALAVGWAASAIAFAGLARRYPAERDLIQLTLGGHLALAAGHALLFDASPGALADGAGIGGAVAALVAIAVSAFACARAATRESAQTRMVLDVVSLGTLAYLTAIVLSGAPLILAWTGEAVALAQIARRTRDRVAGVGSLAFLALASVHALALMAPPTALAYGTGDLGAAALALGAVGLAAFRCARVRSASLPFEQRALDILAGTSVLYLASVAIITAFQPGADAIDAGLGLDVRQQGQAILSAFWSVCGLAALWLGLRWRRRDVRLAGFALLGIAVGKVFLVDLSVLQSEYRVVSFVVLGVLLLASAFAYQRLDGARARNSCSEA